MKNIKRGVVLALVASLFLGAEAVYVKTNNLERDSIIEKSYNLATRPFLTLEQKLERDFKIEYEGDKTEQVIKELHEKLTKIYETNKELIKPVKKIKILTRDESHGLTYMGLAKIDDSITLRCDYTLEMLAHEMAHLKYNHSSVYFKSNCFFALESIPDTKGIGWRKTWIDGTRGAKEGYVSPTAVKNISENLAQYIEKFYEKNYSFWKTQSLKDFNYLRVFNLLLSEDMITEQQYEEVEMILRKNN